MAGIGTSRTSAQSRIGVVSLRGCRTSGCLWAARQGSRRSSVTISRVRRTGELGVQGFKRNTCMCGRVRQFPDDERSGGPRSIWWSLRPAVTLRRALPCPQLQPQAQPPSQKRASRDPRCASGATSRSFPILTSAGLRSGGPHLEQFKPQRIARYPPAR